MVHYVVLRECIFLNELGKNTFIDFKYVCFRLSLTNIDIINY
jgi:hypothetical protein